MNPLNGCASVVSIAAFSIEVASATIVSRYRPISSILLTQNTTKASTDPWQAPRFRKGLLIDWLSELSICNITFSRLEFLREPSPTAFAIASWAFILSALTFHHLHRHDRYQNHSLTLTILSAIGATILSPQSHSTITDLRNNVIWAIILSSMLSALGHRVARYLGIKGTLHLREEVERLSDNKQSSLTSDEKA